ncbi:integrase [Mesorhizobium sp. VK25A]|uniref:Integrase n=1 Tax=Mesorhizobium vachelliae TaxID=3072309 RepID=A0ABU4ZXE6_9HYPH|nr:MULTISPECIES: integrase [unclassified Mesorhizobium]MDX8530075.1 integrase [Mesorhizobium sp. VK25D]MDX8544473.1 integrase [Mesorhizobium sp. VK25A]
MAQRLNALLLQVQMMPKARMATKEQLTKIFALEVEAMREEIDALDRAAKRSGTLRDPSQREADRQVGWAYRLLDAYGAKEELSFEEGGEAREALLDAGAGVDDIPFIAATYQSEREGLLSDRRGLTRSPFLRDVLHRMAQVGLKDTALDRDAAIEEIYRARADALLASATDPRKPKLSGGARERERAAIDVIPAPAPARPNAMWNVDAGEAIPELVPLDPTVAASPANPASTPPATIEPGEATRPVPSPASTLGKGKARKDLRLSGFDEQVEKLIANNQDQWEDDTASDVRVLVGVFRGILEEHGVTHSGEITQEHVAALRQHFNHILPNWGRSPRLRSLSSRELREESRRRADEDEAKGKKIRLGLKPATIRRHLGNLDHFLKHLRSSYFTVPEWTFEGLRPRKPPKGEVRLQQVKPQPEEIRPLYDIPIFTGRLSAENPELPGDLTFHCASFYLPMLYTYLGSRRNEFAGLMVEEVMQRDGHWAIQIKRNEVRRIKNAQSHRLLPLPNELLRLNFIEYVERLKELGHKLLFPELFSPYLEKNDPGDRFYKDFVPVAEKCLPDGLWQRPIHALRHGFADTLKQAGISDGIIEDVSGRLGETETATRYTNPAGLSLLQLIIARYPIITGHLEPKPIRLLPWVEHRQPPPWAGKASGERFGDKRGRRPKKKPT